MDLGSFHAVAAEMFPDDPGTIEAVTWIEDECRQRLADGRTQIPAAMRRNYAMRDWWDQWIKVRSVGAK